MVIVNCAFCIVNYKYQYTSVVMISPTMLTVTLTRPGIINEWLSRYYAHLRCHGCHGAGTLQAYAFLQRDVADDGHKRIYHIFYLCLSCRNVLVQGLANGTVAGIEFLDHALYLFAQSGLVEVYAEDVGTAVELLQA